mmetsp:Transcript_46070/g.120700  ORF Transcript_46070/g.120700 Transcript_46070/m.120700 type:complete len:138 (-) Transcript_46070:2210-2623(-)
MGVALGVATRRRWGGIVLSEGVHEPPGERDGACAVEARWSTDVRRALLAPLVCASRDSCDMADVIVCTQQPHQMRCPMRAGENHTGKARAPGRGYPYAVNAVCVLLRVCVPVQASAVRCAAHSSSECASVQRKRRAR